jgi:uncharacterized protein (TIGR00159 family)
MIKFMTSVFEIFVIALLVNYFLSFFWNKRSMDLLIGAFALLILYAISSWFDLPVLQKIMKQVGNVAAIAALIIFQPELRLALSKLSLKGRKYREASEFDKFLEQLTICVYRLADRKVGALIALEHEDKLDEFGQKGIVINAHFSAELLESIFTNSTPLHDGAVIIKNTTIYAAAVILPLAEDSSQITKTMGTRHRAALGLTQLTDTVMIVVSEETGKVTLFREGLRTENAKPDRFKGILRSVYTTQEPTSLRDRFGLKSWIKT